MYDAPLGAVLARLAAHDRGDRQAVLDPAALVEASELEAAALAAASERSDGLIDAAVIDALAKLHWARFQVLPVGLDSSELGAAIQRFDHLIEAGFDSSYVPAGVRPFLVGAPATDANVAVWAERASSLLNYVEYEHDPPVLNACIRYLQQCLASKDDPHQRSALGVALLLRGERTESRADVEAAVDAARRAAETCELDDPDRAGVLNNLGNALSVRFEFNRRSDDLDDAIVALRQAVRGRSPANATGMFRSNLALALRQRFDLSGHRADIDEAIRYGRRSVASFRGDPELRAIHRTNMALALETRHRHFRNVVDLYWSAHLAKLSLCALPQGHVQRGRALGVLGLCHAGFFSRSDKLRHVNAAVRYLNAALEASAMHPVDVAVHRTALSNVLRLRYDRTAKLDDLEESIRAARGAINPEGRQTASIAPLTNLGNALLNRFEHTGSPRNLTEAVDAFRAALDCLPGRDDGRPHLLSNWASALHTRFEVTADSEDLAEAIQACRDVLTLCSPADPNRPTYLYNHGLALSASYDRDRRLETLDHAIAHIDQARSQVPRRSPECAAYTAGLGNALHTRAEATHSASELHVAIGHLERAIRIVPKNHADVPSYLSNLGAALQTSYHFSGTATDLDRAVDVYGSAVDKAPNGDRRRNVYLSNLGDALRTRADRRKSLGDRRWRADAQRAADVCRTAAEEPTSENGVRVASARCWALVARMLGDHDSALAAYGLAIALLPRLVVRGALRHDSERVISAWQGLAGEAAAHAITAGNRERALDFLESGRAVLWNQAVRVNDIEALRIAEPELAERLTALLVVLDGPTKASRDEILKAAVQFDHLVAEIRSIGPYQGFMARLTSDQLRDTATERSIVILNAAPERCDALLLHQGDIDVLNFPNLRVDGLREQAALFLSDTKALEGRSALARALASRRMEKTLASLWDSVASPVLDRLGHVDPVDGDHAPRLWWCPTGPFTALPIHAARNGADSVLSRVVSSYIPTVGLLSRDDVHPSGLRQSMLAVGMPTTPGLPDLPAATRELELLASLVPDDALHRVVGPDASVSAVLDALSMHAWVHLSCHGLQDGETPSANGVVLHDGTLTVSAVSQMHSPAGEFAFLSACHSHSNVPKFADEVITLAGALCYLGWDQLIATQWAVYQSSAADIAEYVYLHVIEDGQLRPEDVARHLHGAVRNLAAANPNSLTWASFVHIGP